MEKSKQQVRILLVEDERKLSNSIQRQLKNNGWIVEQAFDGVEAEEKVQTQEYTMIILDLNLPRKSGVEFLEELRARSYPIPVLILSARDKLNDRIKGLQIGADDYLVKPFDVGELLARVTAILRRSGFSRVSILKAADLIVDTVQRTVLRGDKTISLSAKEYLLLEFFMRNKNQIVTRKRIAEQVWGYTFDTGTNIIDVYMSYLRKAVDEGYSRKLFYTVYGQGFMLRDEE